MARFKKGSAAAKAYMAKLRGMVGKGKKKVLNVSSPSKVSRKNPRMARRRSYRRGRRRGGFTLPIAPIAGIIGGIAMAKHPWAGQGDTVVSKLMKGNYEGAVNDIGGAFTGFTADGKFHVETLLQTYGPMVVGGLVHYFVGGKMGINRMLGRAKVPIIRV